MPNLSGHAWTVRVHPDGCAAYGGPAAAAPRKAGPPLAAARTSRCQRVHPCTSDGCASCQLARHELMDSSPWHQNLGFSLCRCFGSPDSRSSGPWSASTRCAFRPPGATCTSPPRLARRFRPGVSTREVGSSIATTSAPSSDVSFASIIACGSSQRSCRESARTLHDDARPDARANTLDADTVAATVLRLISETFCRIGGERYAKENGTFGITTLKKSHVERDATASSPSRTRARATFGNAKS